MQKWRGYSLYLSPDEVAVGLLDSPWSVIFDQAENRLHLQKALLVDVFGQAGLCRQQVLFLRDVTEFRELLLLRMSQS